MQLLHAAPGERAYDAMWTALLAPFTLERLAATPAATMVNDARTALQRMEKRTAH